MTTIAFAELEPWEKKYIKAKLGKKHKLVFVDNLDAKGITTAKNADILAPFVHSPIDKKLLNQMPKVKLVSTMSTGYDHIDLKTCKKRKITVCNVPGYGETAVAEHTFALMLALTRKIIESVERTRRGNFELNGLMGIDLKGKTLGVVGTGKIGKAVAHIASNGFGMKVLAFDCHPDIARAKECGFTYTTFDKLLKESDIITFHVPLTKETKHMLNTRNITKLKRGAIVINTSRGAVVETHAIVKGFEEGILSAAGLDVLEEECAIQEEKQLLTKAFKKTCDLKTLLEQHVLLEMPNVIITPHSAFYTKEALLRILDTTIENINGFISGKPVNVVQNPKP